MSIRKKVVAQLDSSTAKGLLLFSVTYKKFGSSLNRKRNPFLWVREALRKHCGKAGPRAEQHGSRRAAVIAGRRNDRALWISGHLRMACRAKVVQEGIEV